jgi:chaperone BCS1
LDYIVAFVKTQLENQFLSGGALLLAFTAFLALLRNLPSNLFDLWKRQFVTVIDVSDHDPAFYWIQKWLGAQSYTQEKSRLLTATTRMAPVSDSSPNYYNREKAKAVDVIFSPAPGRHLIRFNKHFILLHKIRSEPQAVMGSVAYHETFTFQTFSREAVRELIHAAREFAFPPEDQRIAVYKVGYQEWRVTQRKLPRALDSVVVAHTQKTEILDDLKWFFGASSWYGSLGIPYQRGYLFYGEPGNGKTSLVVALAGHFNRDVYILNLSQVTDSLIMGLMAELPEHSIVLIEDLDASFGENRTSKVTDLSFSMFLNSLDGVSAPSGRILILTTNHIERLDAAILRPGRVDMQIKFENANQDMAYRLFLRFFPENTEEAKQFSLQVTDGLFSMSVLQEYLMQHREDAKLAVSNALVFAVKDNVKMEPEDAPKTKVDLNVQ